MRIVHLIIVLMLGGRSMFVVFKEVIAFLCIAAFVLFLIDGFLR